MRQFFLEEKFRDFSFMQVSAYLTRWHCLKQRREKIQILCSFSGASLERDNRLRLKLPFSTKVGLWDYRGCNVIRSGCFAFYD